MESSSLITEHFKKQKTDRRAARKPRSAESEESEKTHHSQDDEVPGPSDQPDDQEILREFDLDWKYGPCTGLSRLERWERAERHGLKPSTPIRDLILEHADNTSYTQCIWKDYAI